MEDKKYSSYPKDLPWQELKAKTHVDETIFKNKGINNTTTSEDDAQTNQNQTTKTAKHENEGKEESRPRSLPHQQVPQPDDFPTQALEQL
nr:hypothetical protein [Tanacetum cinerariifolium]